MRQATPSDRRTCSTPIYDSGMLSIYPISDFEPGADLKNRPTVPCILPRHRVVDIDTAEDWEMAETLYLGHQHRGRS